MLSVVNGSRDISEDALGIKDAYACVCSNEELSLCTPTLLCTGTGFLILRHYYLY
jgi:hypothetical protein